MSFPPLLENMNDNGVLPFISEKCVNPCILPPLCMHSSHIYQLREVLSAVSVSTEEPGIHLGRPGELQSLLGASDICLEATHSQRTNHSFIIYVIVMISVCNVCGWTSCLQQVLCAHTVCDSENEFY